MYTDSVKSKCNQLYDSENSKWYILRETLWYQQTKSPEERPDKEEKTVDERCNSSHNER